MTMTTAIQKAEPQQMEMDTLEDDDHEPAADWELHREELRQIKESYERDASDRET